MTDPGTAPTLAAIQATISEGRFQESLDDLEAYLAHDAGNAEALYMAAVCHRRLLHFDKAQACLAQLKSQSFDQGRVYQEQGHLYLARQRPQQAIKAYAVATQLNPSLLSSWVKQAQILEGLQRHPEARQAMAQVKRLQALPKVLLAVTDLQAQGKLAKAEDLCRTFLRANPTHVEAMRLLASIAVQFGELEDAEYLLESAAEFDPSNSQILIDRINVLRKRQKLVEAQDLAKRLYRSSPDNLQFKSLYAIETMQMGDYETAIKLFDEVLASLPGDAVTLTSRGHALKTLGEQPEAIESYRRAVDAVPARGDAYYALSNLKTYRFTADEVDAMELLEQREELAPADRVHFCFALGKAYEDAGEYARSFDFYHRGNQIKRQFSNYDADQMAKDLQAQQDFFTTGALERIGPTGCDAADPIFIVGLPRAGSTLLEQILSSHSQVEGTLELPNILSMAQRLRRRGRDGQAAPYPDLFLEMSQEELLALGRQYITETRIHRQSAPFFIDKMPNNFRHIGMIKLILPNAKIIDARRDPMACCFSGYKQLFAEGQEFSYDLTDIGRYYSDYAALMDHWMRIFPKQILRVQYEDVVRDLESEVRRILDYCQLPFEEACLSFSDTRRAVRTASSEQVRQPIYKEGLEQWKRFDAHLDELKAALARSPASAGG